MALRDHLRFPNPVNETSARLVASGVVLQGIAFLAVRSPWLLVPLAYGFLARVLAGPTFSPLGQLVTRVVTPRLRVEHRLVAGPPKRFAQGIGFVCSAGALVAALAGSELTAVAFIGLLVVAASLEAFLGFCLGCVIFARLMRWGVIPATVCEECNDLSARLAARARAAA